ncbi:MAG TPA: type II toxin-antitoxin system VapC family toxin [Kofleriaceae bacterium]|nr:type II toxin-antitoxin system VapC family toxin [Kofleriaceae bacterium]
MNVFVDTSVLIDVLRGSAEAAQILTDFRARGLLHSSVVVKAEILAGMRASEDASTRRLLSAIEWHGVDEKIAEEAGRLGRQWLPSHHSIDTADLLIAATAIVLKCPLLTLNIKHFPMFPGIRAPY